MANWEAARWRAASDAIDAILDLPDADRDAALAALRARDAALADDVGRLLGEQAAIDAGRFLDGDARSALPTATSEAGETALPPLTTLPPGSTFGDYRVRRVLGRGGMGVVYEADELASGRRVALKVMQHRFDDAHDRERFARESQLAASIDHEHCVFVFGAAEVDGTPALAMELMQGTLADRLAASGPMAPAAAVDAALQLVSGLKAAHAAGILHRDVKPSNCFVDGAGVVKIGDFGISRSTRPAQETTHATRGQIAATPAYASPEQLRGAPADVRADIYSLGATLYELLTDRRPFSGPDLMSLLMSVANDVPRPPHEVTPAVPTGLSHIVLRCLAKRPEDRFQTYDHLADALGPYASWSPTPATLGRRLLAGLLDHTMVWVQTMPISFALGPFHAGRPDLRTALAGASTGIVLTCLYYGVCEARWGATPGKALLGLTVVDTAGRPARIGRTLVRVLLFMAPGLALALVALTFRDELTRSQLEPLIWLIPFVAVGILFSTSRRRNGYAGVHELASGTRVVSRAARAARPVVNRVETPARARTGAPRTSAFVTVAGEIEGWPGWRPGVDTRLGRAVWIREAAADTPPVDAARAALARPTRLRWLAGRRTVGDAWDVYEAPTGLPLRRALDRRPDWASMRVWLADLARELAAQGDDERPPLDPDRVWILESGRAKLLDDPTVDARHDTEAKSTAFLADVMQRMRRANPAPWPLGAERLLRDLPALPLGDAVGRIEALQRGPAAMTRGWRVAAMAGAIGPAACLSALAMAALTFTYAQIDLMPPDVRVTLAALRALRRDAATPAGTASDRDRLSALDREALEAFLIHNHQATLRGPGLSDAYRLLDSSGQDKQLAARLAARPPVPQAVADAAAANPRVRAVIADGVEQNRPPLWQWALLLAVAPLGPTAFLGVLLAVVCRGAFIRLLGFDTVIRDGRQASRLRVAWRAFLTWSPVTIVMMLSNFTSQLRTFTHVAVVCGLALLVMLVGAACAVWSPTRGLQDRLAGTWLVPR
jgi:uncharacterized RDD family membrane protein YckC